MLPFCPNCFLPWEWSFFAIGICLLGLDLLAGSCCKLFTMIIIGQRLRLARFTDSKADVSCLNLILIIIVWAWSSRGEGRFIAGKTRWSADIDLNWFAAWCALQTAGQSKPVHAISLLTAPKAAAAADDTEHHIVGLVKLSWSKIYCWQDKRADISCLNLDWSAVRWLQSAECNLNQCTPAWVQSRKSCLRYIIQ